MEKVYLVGIEYDDFSDGGFDVVAVAATEEMAHKLARAFVRENPQHKVSMAIREWKVDVHNPVGTVKLVEYTFNEDDFPAERTIPFKYIQPDLKEGK